MNARISALLAIALAGTVLAACTSQADGDAVDRTAAAVEEAADEVADTAAAATDEITDSAAWDRIEGNWEQFTGSVKERWGELTDDEMTELDGNKDQLVGRIQEAYGITRMEAERQVDEWADGLS